MKKKITLKKRWKNLVFTIRFCIYLVYYEIKDKVFGR